jgi:type IV pilus assembly protein PilW
MKHWGNHKGFTLMEVLIALSVFVIVLFAVYVAYESSRTTFTRGQNKVEIQQTARVAMDMLTNEVRMAGYDPSDVMNPPPAPPTTSAIVAANANTLTFIADVDGDNVTDQVTYRLQGTQVIRDLASWDGATFPAPTSEVLGEGVTALTFNYFDASDNPTATLADIRRITVGLTIQGTALGKQETLPLTMDVRLRNL